MGAVKVTLVRAKRPSADPRNRPKTADEVNLVPSWFNSRHFINVLEADEFSPPLAKSYLVMAGGLQFPCADLAIELAARLQAAESWEEARICQKCGYLASPDQFADGEIICADCADNAAVELEEKLKKGTLQ